MKRGVQFPNRTPGGNADRFPTGTELYTPESINNFDDIIMIMYAVAFFYTGRNISSSVTIMVCSHEIEM